MDNCPICSVARDQVCSIITFNFREFHFDLRNLPQPPTEELCYGETGQQGRAGDRLEDTKGFPRLVSL